MELQHCNAWLISGVVGRQCKWCQVTWNLRLETMLPFESYFSSYYSKFRDSSQALLFWKKQKRNENFWFPKVFKKLDHFENRRHDFLVFHSLRNFGKSWEEQFTGKKNFVRPLKKVLTCTTLIGGVLNDGRVRLENFHIDLIASIFSQKKRR